MKPIRHVHSRSVVLAHDNIDTDRIIPARFLTTTTREGLGRHAFQDWRYRSDGSPDPDFVLNRAEAAGCSILVAGRNFGCGSSREHAPWALLDAGIRAVISSEIADIFRSNALKNGLLAITVADAEHRFLLRHPGLELHIDVVAGEIALPDGGRFGFALDAFARHCLTEGIDQIGFLLRQHAAIQRYEEQCA
ncbi:MULTISPECIES: 3-isopropylmalate dehydratase small subunit [Metallibacterium]|jgi:3-isopropylmalate/(R)-2-methylmalate dehydratase small subunit|uniref:3-isopropylmalate dehydratase small subunit n=1 Tax=Metallibacterium TaxID=1218803 RepID=UPI00261424E2|nr:MULTISPECIES: 3-isopropylmalate dehydratase small subunit [Metallibacterium]MBW8075077.1 3-isopropylmalate dehydratase small subunit [Metallibacterium scheffleri]